MNTVNYKDVPVSVFFGISILLIFILYTTSVIKTIPCGEGILNTFMRNFIHIDIYHIIANLFSLYALSRVEQKIGLQRFLILILFLLAFNTIIESAAKKVKPDLKCSIGFSGVLFGIMTWELITTKKLDLYLLLSIITIIILPSLQNSKASLVGHAIGAVSGIIGGLIFKFIDQNK